MLTVARVRFDYGCSKSRQFLVALAWLCAAANCQIGVAAAYEASNISMTCFMARPLGRE